MSSLFGIGKPQETTQTDPKYLFANSDEIAYPISPKMSKVQKPQNKLQSNPNYTFPDADVAEYEVLASSLTWAAMGLQTQLPEIEPTALLEFIESPQVAMSFMEFERDFWNKLPSEEVPHSGLRRRFIPMAEFEKAVSIFKATKMQRPKQAQGLAKIEWKPCHHIAHFMRCVYQWAARDVDGLAIRRHLECPWQLNAILIGALLTYVRVYDLGQFQAFSDVRGSHWGEDAFCPFLSVKYIEWRARYRQPQTDTFLRTWYYAEQTSRQYKDIDDAGRATGDHGHYFTHFAYYARNNFAIERPYDYQFQSDVGFSWLIGANRKDVSSPRQANIFSFFEYVAYVVILSIISVIRIPSRAVRSLMASPRRLLRLLPFLFFLCYKYRGDILASIPKLTLNEPVIVIEPEPKKTFFGLF